MSKKLKYVKNTYRSDIKIVLKNAEKTKVIGTFIFPRYIMNKMTGQVAQTGYAELSIEDYDKLVANSSAFNSQVKIGRLVVEDTAPVTASGFEKIQELNAEIKEYKATIIERESEIESLTLALGDIMNTIASLFGMSLAKLKTEAEKLEITVDGTTKAAYIEAIACAICATEDADDGANDDANANNDSDNGADANGGDADNNSAE